MIAAAAPGPETAALIAQNARTDWKISAHAANQTSELPSRDRAACRIEICARADATNSRRHSVRKRALRLPVSILCS
jgi:hypothetical protein